MRVLTIVLSLAIPLTAAANPAVTCIRSPDIDHETRPDDYTILFTMRNHTVWQNKLQVRCFGLHNEPDGFTYQPTDPATQELCSNQVTIRLNFYRSFCQLGDFSRVK